MISKILRLATFTFLSIFIVSSTFFIGNLNVEAAQMNSMDEADNPLGIVIEKTNEDLDNSKVSSAPDLGDDQAFPFIPGFGKNSGKD